MTEEERKRKLEEMQRDAEEHQISRYKRIKTSEQTDALDAKQEQHQNMQPRFLNQLNKQVYTSNEVGIEERLRRNIHYRQRGDLEENSILKRVEVS